MKPRARIYYTEAQIDVTFGALNLQGPRMDLSNRHTFGELEGVSMLENFLTFEGGLGNLVIHNAAVSIEKLCQQWGSFCP